MKTFCIIFLLFICSCNLQAESFSAVSIASIITAEGTIGNPQNGSYNADGYHLNCSSTGPRFEYHSGQTDAMDWDSTFYPSGTNGSVYVIATSGSTIYIAGQFTLAGKYYSSGIVKWNGSAWSTLGSNGIVGGTIRTIYLGASLYVGGDFQNIDGITAKNIAKWNGTSWSEVGAGTDGPVYAITMFQSRIIVGGNFTHVGGLNYSYLVTWDNAVWSNINANQNGAVYSFSILGSSLYIGGAFTNIGTFNSRYIAKMNSYTDWGIINPPSGIVYTTFSDGTNLYIGGGAYNNICRLNGSNWTSMGSTFNDTVFSICSYGESIYAAGAFTRCGTDTVKGIAKWNGTKWVAVNNVKYTANGCIRCIGSAGGYLYMGGDFTSIDNVVAFRIAKYDGSSWGRVWQGNCTSGAVYTLAYTGTYLYACGKFSAAGVTPANNIARWNGWTWSPVDSGLNGTVYTSLVVGSDLYVGGDFTKAGSTTVNKVAKWDGTQWQAMDAGFDNTVYALEYFNNQIYAAGSFTSSGSDIVNRIAVWDGAKWRKTVIAGNGGPGFNNTVYSLKKDNTYLYAGGSFTQVGDTLAAKVARFDGSVWRTLASAGSASDGNVYSLAVSGGYLYASGLFSVMGGVNAYSIAKWDGNTWSKVGTGAQNSTLYTLAVKNSELYVGGNFTTIGGVSANKIAKWDGTSFTSLGNGNIAGIVSSILVFYSDIYAAGDFTTGGTNPSSYIARFYDNTLPVTMSCFNLNVRSRDVYLDWSTECELNNSGFEIQRKAEGENDYRKIGFVQGNGTINTISKYEYVDKKLGIGTYSYRIKQVDYNGNFEYFYTSNSVKAVIGKPGEFALKQNYPNPSNPGSKIDFQMPYEGKVLLRVYDITGREVQTLLDKVLPADFYTIEFDGSGLASGVYFYRLIAYDKSFSLNFTKTMKMVLVK